MRQRIEQGLRGFLTCGLAFVSLMLLLRVYEFFLLEYFSDGLRNHFTLDLISLGCDIAFAAALLSGIFIVHFILSLTSSPQVAYRVSVFSLTCILTIAAGTISYFAATSVPLSADLFGYSPSDIFAIVASSDSNWLTTAITVIVLAVLFVGCFLMLQRINPLRTMSLRALLVSTLTLFGSWLLPHSRSVESFDGDLDYYVATNKLYFFISRTFQYAKEHSLPGETARRDYPFHHLVDEHDDISQYFNKAPGTPNFVFIIVEGLGRDFTGPGAMYRGFTPYLDSLSKVSLYWENFLSNAGRTFGALPSILGGLPYGREGFMSYGTRMPDHQTLISLTRRCGYTTNFFYGGNPNFDNQDLFLEYQGVDHMVDETKFPASFSKTCRKGPWGFSDRDLFSFAKGELAEAASPRIDVYLTLSTHEPFIVPDSVFEHKFEEQLEMFDYDEQTEETIRKNKSIFSCLLYSDDAIRNLMAYYRSRKDYENTIFIITGDHRLIPLPPVNAIKRFHVPLIVFSPLLNGVKSFSSIALHSDITPSLVNMLKKQYQADLPSMLYSISGPLRASTEFSSSTDLALIRNKNGTNDYIEGEYFLSDDRLFKILPGMELDPLRDDAIKDRLKRKLNKFKTDAIYACDSNRILPEATTDTRNTIAVQKDEDDFIRMNDITRLSADQKFEAARSYALQGNYFESRAILKILLNSSPNYHDARILLARTYGWSREYDSAVLYLNETLERAPFYADAFIALSDVEFWRADYPKSLEIVQQGLKNNEANTELMARKARALALMNKKSEARILVNEILKMEPKQELAVSLKQQLTVR